VGDADVVIVAAPVRKSRSASLGRENLGVDQTLPRLRREFGDRGLALNDGEKETFLLSSGRLDAFESTLHANRKRDEILGSKMT
jgi:hypothetical protein